MFTGFTPVSATIGGALIGLSASILLYASGRIAGVSGILGGALAHPRDPETSWRGFFLAGLLVGGVVLWIAYPSALAMTGHRSIALTAIGGLVVGYGTRLGGGCTSGHGVCGISRLSLRSVVATMTFMATAIAATFVLDHLFGVR